MTIADHKAANPEDELKQTNLVFLRRGGELLLAMKKRGFGAGRWNGVGGKVEQGETVEAAARRETLEEVGVKVGDLAEVATLRFYFAPEFGETIKGFVCTVFVCEQWTDEPVETEEMAPKWYSVDKLPYDEMWPDDPHWLPEVLAGGHVEAEFLFGQNDSMLDMKIAVGQV